jgi:5-methylcytosine-specific restriction endonuclease McrA|tara:strand:- start:379 stop:954 length:576 start_codon:yes stop_codon:yes gene_type:complete
VLSAVENSPVLVLNADYRPLSYFPLSLWSWQDTVKAVFLDRVNVLSEYEHKIRSPSFEMRLPSVIALKEFVLQSRRPAFTRFNVFLRDRFSCQYCAQQFRPEALTFDHLIPKSRGGKTTWENVVTACSKCNLRKGNLLPDVVKMHPINTPRSPTSFELQEHGRMFPPNHLHESWRDFLYWDSELENGNDSD